MLRRCLWQLGLWGIAAALASSGCKPTTEAPPPPEERPSPPQVALWLERGVISAVGSVQADTLSFEADREGTVRLVLGDGCEGTALTAARAVQAGQPTALEVRAEGALATEGLHTLSACFTGTDQTQARSAVRLEVDNTAPTLSVTPKSGSAHCAPPFATFVCSGCLNVAYAFDGQVSFGPEGEVVQGKRYQGFGVPVPEGATLTFRGVDRAGNQTAVLQATYQLVAPSLTVGTPSPAVVSNNASSNQRNTTVSLQGNPNASVTIRRDTGSCASGTVVATATLDGNGAGSAVIYASSLDSTAHYSDPTATVAHPLRACATLQGTCSAEETFTLSRKDASRGWSVQAPVGTTQPLPYWPSEVKLFFLDDSVDTSAASPVVSTRVNTYDLINTPYQLRWEADGVVIAYSVPLPENLRVDIQLNPTGVRDEAGNPLAQRSTFVYPQAGTGWYPFGQKAFTTSGGVVTDTRTGLFWEQSNGWSLRWYQAHQYCHQRGVNAVGGRTDWRLPSARELLTLLDPDAVATSPIFTPSSFTGGITRFWTATAVPGSTDIWMVDFSRGGLVTESQFNYREVRCVAGAIDGGAPRTFERVSFDGTNFVADPTGPVVHDLASGLYWEQAPSSTLATYTASLTACDGTRHNTTGWTLPTAAHFATLHTQLTASPVHELTPFTASTTAYYWVAKPAQYGLRLSDASQALRSSEPVWCVHP